VPKRKQGSTGQNIGQIVSIKFSLLYVKMDSEEMAIFVMLLCFIKLPYSADEGITILLYMMCYRGTADGGTVVKVLCYKSEGR
jgi:hypothetical protein